MKFNYIFTMVSVFMMVISGLFGQSRTLTGSIYDANTGDPLIGANILVKGSTVGAITDIDGNFSIIISGESTLIISYIGYVAREIVVGADQVSIEIELAQGVQLGEVVVTALGIKREERSLGYSVQNLSEEDISNTGTNNVLNALQG